jgi:hypothetical protein
MIMTAVFLDVTLCVLIHRWRVGVTCLIHCQVGISLGSRYYDVTALLIVMSIGTSNFSSTRSGCLHTVTFGKNNFVEILSWWEARGH